MVAANVTSTRMGGCKDGRCSALLFSTVPGQPGTNGTPRSGDGITTRDHEGAQQLAHLRETMDHVVRVTTAVIDMSRDRVGERDQILQTSLLHRIANVQADEINAAPVGFLPDRTASMEALEESEWYKAATDAEEAAFICYDRYPYDETPEMTAAKIADVAASIRDRAERLIARSLC